MNEGTIAPTGFDPTSALNLAGKRAIVTGGGAGMGRAISVYLAAAGATVAVADIDVPAADETVAHIAQAGGVAETFQFDQSREDSVMQLFAAVKARFSGIDILVNNAGIQDRSLLRETDIAYWDRIMSVNLRGPFLCMREAANLMTLQGTGGRIINISSIGSVRAFFDGLGAYNATKAAMNSLTRNGAREFADSQITVNAVLPGPTVTPGMGEALDPAAAKALLPPLGRFGEPEDIADTVLFLASGLGAWITGQTIIVDGGEIAK